MRPGKVFLFILLTAFLPVALPLTTASAEGREITVRTRVTKWGQMPERFEIAGQALPEGITARDFTITGSANGWGTTARHPFECGVLAVEADGDGWSLAPERFPDKYFYVREMTVTCRSHPGLSFTLEDIARTITPTADDFTLVQDDESRLSAHVYLPEGAEALPLVLVFHGYGDTQNLLTYRTAVAWAEPGSQAARPCVVVAPTIEDGFYFSDVARARIYEGIVKYIRELIASGAVDDRRVYVMGNSFGGMASFEIAEQHPGMFAAILALCPALNYSGAGTAGLSKLTNIPVTIAQAEHDETIPASVGKAAAEALKTAGNPNVFLRIYSDAEMNAAGAVLGQENTYSFHHVELAVMEDETYYEWLFRQSL